MEKSEDGRIVGRDNTYRNPSLPQNYCRHVSLQPAKLQSFLAVIMTVYFAGIQGNIYMFTFWKIDVRNNPPNGAPSHDMLCHVRPLLDQVLAACLMEYNPKKENSTNNIQGMFIIQAVFSGQTDKVLYQSCHRVSRVYRVKNQCRWDATSETGLGACVVTFMGITLFKKLLNGRLYACGTIKSKLQGLDFGLPPQAG